MRAKALCASLTAAGLLAIGSITVTGAWAQEQQPPPDVIIPQPQPPADPAGQPTQPVQPGLVVPVQPGAQPPGIQVPMVPPGVPQPTQLMQPERQLMGVTLGRNYMEVWQRFGPPSQVLPFTFGTPPPAAAGAPGAAAGRPGGINGQDGGGGGDIDIDEGVDGSINSRNFLRPPAGLRAPFQVVSAGPFVPVARQETRPFTMPSGAQLQIPTGGGQFQLPRPGGAPPLPGQGPRPGQTGQTRPGGGDVVPEMSQAQLWRYNQQGGRVRLEFLIDEDGRVAQISVAAPPGTGVPGSATSRGVALGSDYGAVLGAYGWPEDTKVLDAGRYYEAWYPASFRVAFTFENTQQRVVRITIALRDDG